MHLIKRFFGIDINLLSVRGINIISWIYYFFSINIQIIWNFLTKKNSYKILGSSIRSDKLLTIKTFSSTIYDVFGETVGLSIFDTNSPLIVDIGANIGQFAFACKYLLPDAKIISFEPNPQTFGLLQKNIESLSDCILYNIGLADSSAKLDFYVSDVSSEWCSFVKPEEGHYDTIKVPVSRGDVLLKDIECIDLMKIDVEGFEKLVLLGCEGLLTRTKYLIIESSIGRTSSDTGSTDLLTYIMSKGFVIHNIGRIYGEGYAKNQGAVDITFKKH